MNKPDWVGEVTWKDLSLAVADVTMDFIYALPDDEFERMRSDPLMWKTVEEHIQQKIVSLLETYRTKGMYGIHS